ncbi:Gfo/Idh/MocA family protein [Microbacterium excoecariae]|uniref:Gfo/Idh/MocA family protein n=1 Tax=Microbacterium excoecariae TaxID=2715210 RepID=UPI00140E90DE|nr:Gfo/Idh/MocA family oxidoreductase [Microbacterium excoecariae]NHI16283.1 Gfo/Idh/MocA family oxidoreductase [Microbacterium excoecariae]
MSRIGLVGFGFGGQKFHLPYIQAAREWELAGVVTRSSARREELARVAPGVPAFDDLDALIDAGVDAVVLTTPPETRRELVLAALARGVHVVADKPFAPNAEVARELARASREAGRILTVFHNRRWDTDIVTARSVLESGSLGTPWRAVNRFDLDDPNTLEVGPAHGLLRDLGSHVVDQMTHLFGPVARVDAHLDWVERDGQRVDAGFVIGMHHRSGVHSTVSASKLNRLQEHELVLYGSAGSYTSHMSDVQTAATLAGRHPLDTPDWGVEAPKRWGTLHTAAGSERIPSLAGDYADYYRALHAAVAGEAPVAVTLDEAIHTVEITDAARRSDAEGRSIEL